MKYIFANWKMYLDYQEAAELSEKIKQLDFDTQKIQVVVFPSSVAVKKTIDTLDKTNFSVGAQNVSWVPKGAYTGSVSALIYKNLGCTHALVGHSERRYVFGEKDSDVRKKIEACLDVGLVPVVCIGENQEEKDNGKREYRLKKQLYSAFNKLQLNGGQVIVAYEPVWAIGTGTPCEPLDADDVHGWIKQELKKYFGDKNVPVLYGGSVEAENVLSYISLSTVDGVLVGSASTKFDSFLSILKKQS